MASEMKFTPGPWEVAEPMPREVWIMANHLHVASIPRAADGDWSPANAAIVAAAPRLFEQHCATLADLELLLKAVRAGDPQQEIELRIKDTIMFVQRAIALAAPTEPRVEG